MRSENEQIAGSMPESVPRRAISPFDEIFVQRPELTDFQHKVGSRILRLAQELRPEYVTVRATIGGVPGLDRSVVLISFLPRNDGCAEMTVYIESQRHVYIGVGHGLTYSLPDDVWDPRAKDAPRFAAQIVGAVIAGKLTETIFYRGGVATRWVSELDVEGIPVSMDRGVIPSVVLGLFKRRSKETVRYVPYAGARSQSGHA